MSCVKCEEFNSSTVEHCYFCEKLLGPVRWRRKGHEPEFCTSEHCTLFYTEPEE